MNFCSDNVTGCSPEILTALAAANSGSAMPYGHDKYTQQLQQQFSDLFEKEVLVFPVATGSAANALALSVLTPPFGAIYCHQDAHINADECGAPEFYTGGAKLVPLPGQHGKLSAADLALSLKKAEAGVVHHVQPAAVSLTQGTEAGTTYKLEEIQRLAEITHTHGLSLHMDGARFANALVSLGCTPAQMTWKSGVDVLSFGATKNGAMAAEAVVFFNPALAATFRYRRKRGGHLFSKMRFLSVQLQVYLEDNLWLRNARHANQMAVKLASGLALVPGVHVLHPVEINEIFVYFPQEVVKGLLAAGFNFYYTWDDQEQGATARLVTAFDTQEEDVQAFVETAHSLAASSPAMGLAIGYQSN